MLAPFGCSADVPVRRPGRASTARLCSHRSARGGDHRHRRAHRPPRRNGIQGDQDGAAGERDPPGTGSRPAYGARHDGCAGGGDRTDGRRADLCPHRRARRPPRHRAPAGRRRDGGGDIEWRQAQIQAGKLEFPCGKQELIRLGHFDDVDLAMMIHTNWRREDGKAGVPASNNGRVGKTARFIGRAAHAGSAPHLGINALYAAQVALAGINAVRETFRDEDSIRVHPILTHGGSQVNVIPGEARLEMYVRGKSAEGVAEASARVDRALRAGALALGAQVEIETLPGPMPLLCDGAMAKLFESAARGLVGEEHYRNIPHRSGSTDMGDLSQIMPILHPYMGGATGAGHSAEFHIVDKELGYVLPAKALASMAIDLLAEGGAGAHEVLKTAKPPMTRAGYLAFQRGIARRERCRAGRRGSLRASWE